MDNLYNMQHLKPHLERLYRHYNHRRFVSPDPLQTLYDYPDPRDQEVVGVIAASLAFGNVQQILLSIGRVLGEMGPHPHLFLMQKSRRQLERQFRGFQYRYVRERELVGLLEGMASLLHESGTLAAAFAQAYQNTSDQAAAQVDVLPALDGWVKQLLAAGNCQKNYLLPVPGRGSACKRWHLYLRWMIREDTVDLGAWQALLGQDVVPAKALLVPMDTHMYRLSRALDMTQRKSADSRAVREVSAAFRRIAPSDPVRYDFAMTRLGIRRDPDLSHFIDACQAAVAAP